jgi:hypothetical protein
MPAQALTRKGDLLGPDVKGVTACRERAWVARFLAAPDGMRAFNNNCARGATVLSGSCVEDGDKKRAMHVRAVRGGSRQAPRAGREAWTNNVLPGQSGTFQIE